MCKGDLKQTACLTLLVTTASAMFMKWDDSVITWKMEETSLTRPTFFTFFYNSGNNAASQKLRSYTIAIITPMRQARTCVWVLAPRSTPSGPKQWSQMFILRLKPCLREIATDEILKENIIPSDGFVKPHFRLLLLCSIHNWLNWISSISICYFKKVITNSSSVQYFILRLQVLLTKFNVFTDDVYQ